MIKNLYKSYVYFVIFIMKKIILGILTTLFLFAWYSYAEIYSADCPSDWKIKSGETVCWSCAQCRASDMYWKTKTIGSCNKTWTNWCCSWWVVYNTGADCCYWETYKNKRGNDKCCEKWNVVVRSGDIGECKTCDKLTADEVTALWDKASVCNQQCAQERQYRIANWLTWCCPNAVNASWECDMSLSDIWITINTDCLLRGWCSLNVYQVMWIRKSNPTPTVWGFFQDIVLAATTFVWTVVVLALIVSGLIFAFWSISWKDTKRAKTILIDCFVWLLLVMWSYTIIRLIQFIATAWS